MNQEGHYPNTCLQILQKTRDLLSDESKWNKGFLNMTPYGSPSNIYHDHATSWCLTGALFRYYKYNPHLKEMVCTRIMNAINEIYPYDDFRYTGITSFNDCDNTDHEDILKVLDMAIEEEQAGIAMQEKKPV